MRRNPEISRMSLRAQREDCMKEGRIWGRKQNPLAEIIVLKFQIPLHRVSSRRSTDPEALSPTEPCEQTGASPQQETPVDKAPEGPSDGEEEHPLL